MDMISKRKIWVLSDLLPYLERIRDVKKIVLANGCFDLVHVGHLRYLQGAKNLGDILIVGINSDSSVKALKGDPRPLAGEMERAELIAGFECVDYVFIFEDLTADKVLLQLKPHVHAKGTDYTEDSVPERETVSSYGGITAVTGDPKDHSSRDIIRRIAEHPSGGSSEHADE